jgi:hypothetical protein
MNAWVCAFGIVFLMGSVGTAHAANANVQGTPACRPHEQQASTDKDGADCAPQPSVEDADHGSDGAERVEMTVGSPPMQSDDTGTPGPGKWEINLGIYGDLTGGTRLVNLPSIDINYGYGEAVQFSYTLPVVFSDQAQPDGALSRSVDGWRLGESEAGIKYRFYDNKDTGLAFAIYPQVRFRTPGVDKAIPDGSTVLVLPMLATWEFAHASMTANAGIESSSGRHFAFASFGIGTRLTDRVALMAEVVGENLNVTNERVVLFDIGIRRKITDRQSISAALGRDLDVGGDRQEHAYFAIAYQMLFGR